MLDVLLIYAPVAVPSEPPLGVASLAAFLREGGMSCEVLDLNVEAFARLLSPDFPSPDAGDRFTLRSLRGLGAFVSKIRSTTITRSLQRYKSAISHLQRVLWLRTKMAGGPLFTFTDLRHPELSPLRTQDLHRMAQDSSMGPIGEWMESRVLEVVRSLRPKWVGFSVQYLSQALPSMALAGALHRCVPRVRVVIGGGLITSWARVGRLPNLKPWVQYLIPGRGERALARLLGRGSQEAAADRRLLPQFRGLPLGKYFSPEPILPMATSRGCYWGRCRFCPEADGGESFRSIPPGEIPWRMEKLASRYSAQWLHLTDNAIPFPTLQSLARSRVGIPWFGFARLEAPLTRPELAKGLYRSGCRMLQLGLESGSPRTLNALRKGISLHVACRALRVLREEGVTTYVYLLFGTPGETVDDLKLTTEFVCENAPWIDYLHCSILNLPREEANSLDLDLREFLGGAPEDLSLYVDFRPRSGLNRKDARRFLEREFSKEPKIRSILNRDPPCFGSSHAALLACGRS